MIIGIVGCGGIAYAHVKALNLIKEITEIALYDVITENMIKISQITQKRVKLCENLRELALHSDCFIICTPNNRHLETAKNVLAFNQIPFLCEKPISIDLASAKQLESLAPPKSLICFNYRYNQLVKKIQETITQRGLGHLVFFSANFSKNSSYVRAHTTWRDSLLQKKSSGALGDLSCHLLDMFCLFSADSIDIGQIKVLSGTRVPQKRDGMVEVDDNGYVFGRSLQGAMFQIRASKSDTKEALGLHFNLIFQGGELTYSTASDNIIRLTSFDKNDVTEISLPRERLIDDPPREVPYWSDSFYYLLKDWCSSLTGKQPSASLPYLAQGLHIQEVIESF